LTLLAATWQGEPLPRQRFKIYARLVELLVEKHPRMRQRATHAGGGPLADTEVPTLFAAVAYGAFSTTRWAWQLGLIVNGLAFVSAAFPYRGWVSGVAIAVALLSVAILLTPAGRRAFRG
jgi:hypothetical protein